MIRQSTPEDAAEILRKKPDAAYLDVRTVEEFQAGHPAGAYNIPVVFFDTTRRPVANPDFEQVVQAAFPKEKTIIVGCQAGTRSQRACEILQSLGFRDVTNMQGGFGGARGPGGVVTTAGWKERGLPVESSSRPGAGYEDLKKKA